MVTFALDTQVMILVSAGISNGENNQRCGIPMILEIMISQTQPREFNLSMTRLPVGVYTDQTSCQSQVNDKQYLQISSLKVEGNKELCPYDGGSNN
eukprot:1794081-Ditylum_brightwellii.AAC.1